jgi:hypothetical protein
MNFIFDRHQLAKSRVDGAAVSTDGIPKLGFLATASVSSLDEFAHL